MTPDITLWALICTTLTPSLIVWGLGLRARCHAAEEARKELQTTNRSLHDTLMVILEDITNFEEEDEYTNLADIDHNIPAELADYMPNGTTAFSNDDWDHIHICPTGEVNNHQDDDEGDCPCQPTIIPLHNKAGKLCWAFLHHITEQATSTKNN